MGTVSTFLKDAHNIICVQLSNMRINKNSFNDLRVVGSYGIISFNASNANSVWNLSNA